MQTLAAAAWTVDQATSDRQDRERVEMMMMMILCGERWWWVIDD